MSTIEIKNYIGNLAQSSNKDDIAQAKAIIRNLSQTDRKVLKKILEEKKIPTDKEIQHLNDSLTRLKGKKIQELNKKHKPWSHGLKNLFFGRISSDQLLRNANTVAITKTTKNPDPIKNPSDDPSFSSSSKSYMNKNKAKIEDGKDKNLLINPNPVAITDLKTTPIEDIDFTALSSKDLNKIFSERTSDECTAAFTQLSEENFKIIFNHLDISILKNIPDSCLNYIDYTTISRPQFDMLFAIDNATIERRLSHLTPNNFKMAVNKFSFAYQWQAIPVTQFDSLDWKELTKDQIKYIFPPESEKFQWLTSRQIKDMFTNIPLYCFSLIKPKHLMDKEFVQMLFQRIADMKKEAKVLNQEQKRKYCEVLGVNEQANLEEIKAAYKKLSLKYHPDRITQQENETVQDFQARKESNTQAFQKIAEAFEVLTEKPMPEQEPSAGHIF